MKVKQLLTFIITLALTFGCFMLGIHHNTLARIGLYEFINPMLLNIIFSLIISLIIFSVHKFAIAAILLLCLLANLPASAMSNGGHLNQDILFTILVVALFLPTAVRWIEN